MKRLGNLTSVILLAVCVPAMAFAQAATNSTIAVPRLIRFSGTLGNIAGKPATGLVGVTFSLYEEEQGGSPIWTETQNVRADAGGRYTVVLGSTRNEGMPAEAFASGQGRWLGVQAQGESERPRSLLVSVPYALKAVDAETLGGLPASAFVLANASAGAATPVSRPVTAGKTADSATPNATPSLTGTGQGGFVALWDNTTTLSDSVIVQTASKNIAIGTSAPVAKFDVYTPATIAIEGQSTAASGSTYGVYGAAASTIGNGVWGQALATSGAAYGVVGETNSADVGVGVYGSSPATSGAGVEGVTTGTNGAGVYGTSKATTGNTSGVVGYSASGSGSGVYGVTTATTATSGSINAGVSGYSIAALGYGVYGQSNSGTTGTGVAGVAAGTQGVGVSGLASAPSGINIGVYGTSNSSAGYGVQGLDYATSGVTYGVAGFVKSPTGYGAFGQNGATSGAAVGISGSSYSSTGYGVVGTALATTGRSYGVYGSAASPQGIGVHGDGNTFGAVGVTGSTSSGTQYGVYGQNIATTGDAWGVYGESFSTDGTGTAGIALATTGSASGVYGNSYSPDGIGILANATAGGTALEAIAESGAYAGDFTGAVIIEGDLEVTGAVSKGGGSFKIDHPLDPANKYLSHSFVESPDMMNVYNGNVTTDKQGRATVILPEYFEALNGEFRYQLTVIGQFAQAIVSQKIAHNRFAIRTNKPLVEVSWQVTGIRHDAYAEAHRIPVDEDKPTAEQGYYLHPDAFGQPESKSIAAARISASKQLASALGK